MSGNVCCGGSTPKLKVKSKSCCETEKTTADAQCGCGKAVCGPQERIEASWITGYIQTPAGEVPQASTSLSFKDILGFWKCRWSIGRMDYKIDPGIYCIGTPDENSPVLVTANYKMTFDKVREQLSGLNLWIVVLDTDGVNVWCAAGKGTFGTEELVYRIAATQLSEIVSHRTIILPQLGAVGVAAHDVAKQTGFRVVYGPVRAADIKVFLSNGMKASEEMRTVKFTAIDRLVLTPMELVGSIEPAITVLAILFILNAIGFGHYGFTDLYALLGSVIAGAVLAPVLLPWIPGRAFSFKGFVIGLLWALTVNLINGFPFNPLYGWLQAAAYLLILPSISAYITMNFTGSSTYTSLSGVDKEMKIALPLMLFATGAGILLLLLKDFIMLFI